VPFRRSVRIPHLVTEPTPSNDEPSIASKIWGRLRPYRKRMAASLALLLVAVPLTNFHPLVWGIVADQLVDRTLTPKSLGFWLAVMLATYAFGLAANAVHSFLLEKVGQGFVRDIRNAIFAKFEAQSLAYHHDSNSGELVTRIVSDVDVMEQSVLQGLTKLLEECVTFVVVAGMVLWISPLVGSLSILPLALSFVFIRIYNRRIKAIYDGVRKSLGRIGSFVGDRLGGVEVTQIFGRGADEKETFAKKADAFYGASVRASRIRNSFFPLVSLFGFVNNLVMLGVGAWLIMRDSGAFTIGALLAYRGFWWRLQSPIRTIAQTSDILQRARAAAARVFELLDAPVAIENKPGARPLPKPARGAVALEGVSFSYVAENPVLKEVSFSIEPGEFLAIAGGSGSGKSTLLKLVPRFYDADSGSVRVDGHDVREVELRSLRSAMGLVGQDSYLFDGTVAENLRYARPEATQAEIESCARAANAHDFILELPKGYDTHVGQRGVKLSGGQRQRLSLARALLANPVLLLLDEPTASVEPESEALIHESILRRKEAGDGTTLLATHRVDLLRQAPRVLFLDDGHLVGDGTHEELLAGCTAYREAYFQWQQEEHGDAA
jgi:ABC-type multidrug transport system fused ATPase/permease subunit